jgi:hypothetical protein
VAPTVAAVLAADPAAVAVGCCVGADAAVLSALVAAGVAPRVRVFAAFGPDGAGACGASSVAGVAAARRAGAAVSWWSGGGPRVPLRGRLAQRSLALVRSLAPAGALVAFVATPPPHPFGRGAFPPCGSGTWSAVATAARLGVVPVVVSPLPVALLPPLPTAGAWAPGPWPDSWRWAALQQPLLF